MIGQFIPNLNNITEGTLHLNETHIKWVSGQTPNDGSARKYTCHRSNVVGHVDAIYRPKIWGGSWFYLMVLLTFGLIIIDKVILKNKTSESWVEKGWDLHLLGTDLCLETICN